MHLRDWLSANGESAQFATYGVLLMLLGLLEHSVPARADARKRGRWLPNFALTALNVVVLGLLPLSFVAGAEWADERSLGLLNVFALPLPAQALLGLLARGFISWITHLLMHKVPLFWRVHRVHHTDTALDVSTTVRFHPFEFPIGLAVGLPLVVTFGISPWILLAYEILDAGVTLLSHANVQLPPRLERIVRYFVVTPGLHRVHHSTVPEEADSNFGAVFPVWDLVFGTFRTKTAKPSLDMPLGLAEVRDQRVYSIGWLLALPFLALRTDDNRKDQAEPVVALDDA